ncbi:MAG: hypothetical protein A2845_02615 [Candidatus Lloydbacteria bacterium RIFCSPHIGHO2_01_FULL_49_22]|uniref:Type 4 fimbrial biogenesis protein PilX N-terminal domain-containing protein n=1 Tax=Candidatus Lloydbacteria bacterium RIFCSPHIGHO2_01_FULL_49_22 TaxID=1798658 RepID=A0A1G2CUW3_9BACT|nr:MAG: hypothetical protein A2845_02615 [Candidatus Lloydbacteria bacterium RIFCSPHIGHO2_01_FULL_49_22]OGZ10341.1 MAG: hypothetical protein A3C14_02315 [Candidatus Lloydbacteria bacterium RIFCSPHIGHO2_02_FULL_50_18]
MKYLFHKKVQKGFSTLFIVIVLGGTALSLTLALATSSMWSIRGSINTRNGVHAKALVNACAEVALETLRENNSYTGTGNVMLNESTCTYTVSNTGGTSRAIAVVGSVSDIVRNVHITTGSLNPLVVSLWQER